MAKVEVEAEVTGVIWQIKVKMGDKVKEGDTLLILESMKMEIPLLSPESGIVSDIMVQENQVTSEGETVIILET